MRAPADTDPPLLRAMLQDSCANTVVGLQVAASMGHHAGTIAQASYHQGLETGLLLALREPELAREVWQAIVEHVHRGDRMGEVEAGWEELLGIYRRARGE